MRQLIADLFISLDGFASGKNEPPYFGYFGPELWNWIRENLGTGRFELEPFSGRERSGSPLAKSRV
jgi:hypothetical protein